MTIRPLTPADAPAHLALFLRGVADHPACFRLTPADAVGTPAPFGPVETGRFTLGAFVGGALVGVVSFEREARPKLAHRGLLFRMYVAREAAGRGAGRALVDGVLGRARGLGVEAVLLTVVATNDRARALYAAAGFAEIGREPGAIRDGATDLDELTMRCALGPPAPAVAPPAAPTAA